APESGGAKRNWLLIAAIGAAIPALAVAVYLVLGSPGTPGKPFSGVAQQGGATGEDMAGQPIEAAISNLVKRLEADPNNLEGWLLLGRSLITLERYEDAAQALRTAVTLSDGDPEIIGSMAETLVFAAQGIVTTDALVAFQTVLSMRPNDVAAQYYIGISLAQQGRPGDALEMWRKLAAETPVDAPWRADLITWMRRAAEETGTELGSIPSAPASARQTAETASGPSQEDIAAAAEMSPEERMDMIRSMVEQLAARLVDEPDDLDGWRRLANSYRVLGEDSKAAAAQQRVDELEARTAQPAQAGPEPSAEDVAAAAEMSPEERMDMIRSMVEQLAARLVDEPDDLDGWLRLGRSYSVLGRHAESRDAYARAADIAPDDTAVLRGYARAVMNAAGDATQFPEQAITLYQRILELDPNQLEALWFMGFVEAADGHSDTARGFWNRLLDLLPPGSADRGVVERALKDLPD
ncbi:MAG: tetratricopeptide repeat protein, partial [Alphaproteobacteria bacterium]